MLNTEVRILNSPEQKIIFEDIRIGDTLLDKDGENWIAMKPGISTNGNLNKPNEIYILPKGESKKVNGSLGFNASKEWLESNMIKIYSK